MELQEKTAEFRLDRETGYFTSGGVDMIAFEDICPEGHQGGISLLMHGERIAANGDVRFEPAPGQWQPVPAHLEREVDAEKGRIVTRLRYPDEIRHLLGFNPMVYPDCAFEYTVSVQAERRRADSAFALRGVLSSPHLGRRLDRLAAGLRTLLSA